MKRVPWRDSYQHIVFHPEFTARGYMNDNDYRSSLSSPSHKLIEFQYL